MNHKNTNNNVSLLLSECLGRCSWGWWGRWRYASARHTTTEKGQKYKPFQAGLRMWLLRYFFWEDTMKWLIICNSVQNLSILLCVPWWVETPWAFCNLLITPCIPFLWLWSTLFSVPLHVFWHVTGQQCSLSGNTGWKWVPF